MSAAPDSYHGDAFVVHELADGKVVRMRPYPDRESAEAAIGYTGEAPSGHQPGLRSASL